MPFLSGNYFPGSKDPGTQKANDFYHNEIDKQQQRQTLSGKIFFLYEVVKILTQF